MKQFHWSKLFVLIKQFHWSVRIVFNNSCFSVSPTFLNSSVAFPQNVLKCKVGRINFVQKHEEFVFRTLLNFKLEVCSRFHFRSLFPIRNTFHDRTRSGQRRLTKALSVLGTKHSKRSRNSTGGLKLKQKVFRMEQCVGSCEWFVVHYGFGNSQHQTLLTTTLEVLLVTRGSDKRDQAMNNARGWFAVSDSSQNLHRWTWVMYIEHIFFVLRSMNICSYCQSFGNQISDQKSENTVFSNFSELK